jgi:outer membrane protein assembly factor BamB
MRAYHGASLAVRGPNAAYCAAGSLICLDRSTGKERWRVPSGVSFGGGLRARREPGVTVALVLSDEAAYLAWGKSLTAFSLKDGAKLWSGPTQRNHYK